MAQLNPKPEVRRLNPVIGKNSNEHLFTVNCVEKTKIKKKRPRLTHFKSFYSSSIAGLSVPNATLNVDRIFFRGSSLQQSGNFPE